MDITNLFLKSLKARTYWEKSEENLPQGVLTPMMLCGLGTSWMWLSFCMITASNQTKFGTT